MRPATRTALFVGLGDSAPFIVVIIPFAMLFGLVASEAGWTLVQIMAMTVLVVAGAAQFTAVQMMAENVPIVIVVLTALAVNLRLAMYSASLALHVGEAPLWQRAVLAYALVDQNYATAIRRWSMQPMGLREKLAYFAGTSLVLLPLWYAFTWVGVVAGSAIPEALALDFAVPITFIAMVAPLLRDRPHLAAAATAAAASLLLARLPFSLGILAAACLAMGVGAAVEALGERGR
jgi:predicted branched-subunit amino acid permease